MAELFGIGVNKDIFITFFKRLTLMIYDYFLEKCDVPFHKIGCFQDDMQVPRPLPVLLFTDRDETSPVSSGIALDWNNWSAYLTKLVCRCSKAAKDKGYSFFSIQFYGKKDRLFKFCIN